MTPNSSFRNKRRPFSMALLLALGLLMFISASLLLTKNVKESQSLQIGGTAISVFLQTMPTRDRLAQPTLPASPSQADYGSQEFWFQCLPCHGDRGQGLTDEFRETYPPEDRNCWEAGCHGERPYENGWTIPQYIPAVIGPDNNLKKFFNAKILHNYICAAMPYQWPGTLEDETCWKLTAFLLRENGILYTKSLSASTADRILLLPKTPTPTPTLVPTTPLPDAPKIWLFLLIIFLLGGILFFRNILRLNSNSHKNKIQ